MMAMINTKEQEEVITTTMVMATTTNMAKVAPLVEAIPKKIPRRSAILL